MSEKPTPGFRQRKAVEFHNPNGWFRRSTEAAFTVKRFDKDSYNAYLMKTELKDADYLHVASQDADVVFDECADSLDALLKRGGAILFKAAPGPKAHAYLEKAGVFDPYPDSLESVPNDSQHIGKWTAPTNCPLYTSCHKLSPENPGRFGYPVSYTHLTLPTSLRV